jgi:hypothetical protein
MPKFDLAPLGEDLDPVWPAAPARPSRKMSPAEARAVGNRRIEEGAASVPVVGGVLKPIAQFGNALASPETKMGIITGPVNGISKLGNALGDLVQGKPWRGGRALTNPDVSQINVDDAWTISDKTARQLNPWRIGTGQGVTPADEAGLALGEGIGAEIAGAALGTAIVSGARRIPAAQQAFRRLVQTRAARRVVAASRESSKLRTGLLASKSVLDGLGATTLAAAFLDQEDGNLANVGDAVGLKLPGRVEKGDNYLLSTLKSIGVEGIAAPMALMGVGMLVPPIRKVMSQGNLGAFDEIPIAPYSPVGMRNNMPRPMAGPGLPAAGQSTAPADAASIRAGLTRAEGDALNEFSRVQPGQWSQGWNPSSNPWEAGGAIVPYDSAIGRSLQEQTQIRQVAEQRQRLQDMGLVVETGPGQLQLNLGNVVDPEARLMIRGLQVQRGQLIRQANRLEAGGDAAGAQALMDQLPDLDAKIQELQFSPQNGLQGELDIEGVTPQVVDLGDEVDLRPELDTYLAQLDELSDADLRDTYRSVFQEQAAQRSADALAGTQARLEELNQWVIEIQARAEAGEITEKGAKRLVTKAQKEIDAVQQQLAAIERRQRVPETLVGDQLRLKLPPDQLELDMATSTGDELSPVNALRYQRDRIQAFADDVDAQIQALRQGGADQDAIAGVTNQRRALAETLKQLNEELEVAQKQLSPEAQLQLASERWRTRQEAASEFGYETSSDYRNALESWNRDQLRRVAMPDSSPEVAALVKARTGRRVWQAKKSDIIDALVELSERRGRYLPPQTPASEQIGLRLTSNEVGGDAPLFDRPAELNVPGMGQVLDADDNELPVPMGEFRPRGLDAQTREQMKAEILQRAIDNGEVQAPVSPLPERPATEFNQTSLVDELFSDQSGQLTLDYATDQLPTYQAAGRNADALIEEMRLRFQYDELDVEAQRAQREAFLAEKGWDTMSWEEKKKLGLQDPGLYALGPFTDRYMPNKAQSIDSFRVQQFNPELPAPVDRTGLRIRIQELEAANQELKGNKSADAKKTAAANRAEIKRLTTQLDAEGRSLTRAPQRPPAAQPDEFTRQATTEKRQLGGGDTSPESAAASEAEATPPRRAVATPPRKPPGRFVWTPEGVKRVDAPEPSGRATRAADAGKVDAQAEKLAKQEIAAKKRQLAMNRQRAVQQEQALDNEIAKVKKQLEGAKCNG